MKKIPFLVVTLFLMALGVQRVDAQATFSHTASNPTGAITNTGVDTMTYTLTHGYNRIMFHEAVARASGTLAGTAILEYSVTGTSGSYQSDAGDTLTLTNVAAKYLYWNKTNTARYWRIRTTGSGTMTATTVGKLQTD